MSKLFWIVLPGPAQELRTKKQETRTKLQTRKNSQRTVGVCKAKKLLSQTSVTSSHGNMKIQLFLRKTLLVSAFSYLALCTLRTW